MFQYPGPQQEPWGHPLVTVLSIRTLFVKINAGLLLKYFLVRLYKFLGQLKSFRAFKT